jgi:alpha-glucosidase
MVGREKDWIIQQHKRGDFITTYDTFRIHLIGLPFEITTIELDNEVISMEDVQFDPKACALIIKKDFTELHLSGI